MKDTSLYLPEDLHVGRASELHGRDRLLYRALEILPGTLSWLTLIGVVFLSFFAPVAAAYLIIAFSLFWLLKTIYLSLHVRHNWRRLKRNMNMDWEKMLEHFSYGHLRHLILLPYYQEDYATVSATVAKLAETSGDKKKIYVVLAPEERAGKSAQEIAERVVSEYGSVFGYIGVSVHPKDVPGEMAGKGSNIAHAAQWARTHVLDPQGISYKDVIVSAFDIDTVVYPQYFLCLNWYFLTTERPDYASFQPVPLYNNNIWEAPSFSRVAATSGTFWQMIQQERPEKLATFSSHAVSFAALHRVGYWQKNMVSEDSRIFWNMFFAHNGDYRVVPISYPVSMDANLAVSTWQTFKNIYKQNRRWTYGVENVPYIIYHAIRNKRFSLFDRLRMVWVQIEGFWSLATHPLILFSLGWLPLLVGGREFSTTILSYNLPIVARTFLTLAMGGLIVSAIISTSLLPERPQHCSRSKYIGMTLQWILVPVTMIVFSAIPGLDAQTRLMFGRYMGFWVTPKRATRST
ncbi:MAG: glycosyltransferase family 2 protein [Candidatus Pacebacteria bacterium]|nr:glycosyltransferase family 2 protein [Candidatus Paceibacterota bacterium]